MNPPQKLLQRIRRLNRAGPAAPAAETAHRPPRRAEAWPALSPDQAAARWLAWFTAQGWTPFPFQREAWDAFQRGRSGLIAVATGSGKTYAAVGGPLIQLITRPPSTSPAQLSILYVSPIKALVRDIAQAITKPLEDLQWPVEVGLRTGDTAAVIRRRFKVRVPHVLVTTPESLALLLTEEGWEARMQDLQSIVLDEWHELLGTKRGSLLELSLARLRSVATQARVWALSATIANLDVAAAAAVASEEPTIIRAEIPRNIQVRAILPASIASCPWFGYSGLRLLSDVVRTIDPSRSTLIFTNTRSHAERWYQAIREDQPQWADSMALHHGSLDQDERHRVEDGIKSGRLRLVVATSSLDLGVDFPQVEDVIQIGSAKSIARAIQRAGRAFHRPGEQTQIRLCPTNVLEIVESAAVREALRDDVLEERAPLAKPLDVYVQFLLNSAFQQGFVPAEVLAQARSTYSFRAITDEEASWALHFIQSGGSLSTYPEFRKIQGVDGYYRFASPALARQHKMNIGTILSDSGVLVQMRGGAKLGVIDETFAAKLRPGDVLQFGGRTVAFLQMRDMTAFVKPARDRSPVAAVWNGTILPLSAPLSLYVRREIDQMRRAVEGGPADSPEIAALLPIARIQHARSRIPAADQTLVEQCRSREGHHLFVYTWEGWSVNEGLGHVAAYRLSHRHPNTIAVSANNYGFELLSTEPLGTSDEIRKAISHVDDLEQDIHASLNYPELAKRAFREIARVAGLIHQGTPFARKSTRHLHMSASLLFDVLRQYEPDHPLLTQAYREVYEQPLQLDRLRSVMAAIAGHKLLHIPVARLTPFAFPLFVERIRSRLSTENFEQRIARLQREVFR